MDPFQDACEILTKLAQKDRATVHAILGTTSEGFCAEVLQAAGVTPSFTHDVREVDDFVDEADAVLIQIGTHNDAKENGILTAIDTARKTSKPWVLNPRSAHRSIYRRELARRLAEMRPRIVYGRPAEINAITRSLSGRNASETAAELKTVLARGDDDIEVMNAIRGVRIQHFHPLTARIELFPSAVSALCATFASVELDGFKAACSASFVAAILSQKAGAVSRGPGSFVVNFLDELYALTPDTLHNAAGLIALENVNPA